MVLLRIVALAAANVAVGLIVYFSTGQSIADLKMAEKSTIAQGQIIWQQKKCISCHSIYGLGGHLGPDLTNIIKRRGDDYTRALIRSGNNKMPAQSFNSQELDQLMAYLQRVGESGTYPPTSLTAPSFGEL